MKGDVWKKGVATIRGRNAAKAQQNRIQLSGGSRNGSVCFPTITTPSAICLSSQCVLNMETCIYPSCGYCGLFENTT